MVDFLNMSFLIMIRALRRDQVVGDQNKCLAKAAIEVGTDWLEAHKCEVTEICV